MTRCDQGTERTARSMVHGQHAWHAVTKAQSGHGPGWGACNFLTVQVAAV